MTVLTVITATLLTASLLNVRETGRSFFTMYRSNWENVFGPRFVKGSWKDGGEINGFGVGNGVGVNAVGEKTCNASGVVGDFYFKVFVVEIHWWKECFSFWFVFVVAVIGCCLIWLVVRIVGGANETGNVFWLYGRLWYLINYICICVGVLCDMIWYCLIFKKNILLGIFDDTRAFWPTLKSNVYTSLSTNHTTKTPPQSSQNDWIAFSLHHPSHYSTEFQTSNIIHLKIATFY